MTDHTLDRLPPTLADDHPAGPTLAAAAAGAVGALAGIGASELLAGVLGGPSLIAAIGSLVIDLQPPGAKDVVVALFGENDKLALEIVVVLAALAFGAILGLLARRSYAIGVGGFLAFALLGFVAAVRPPDATPTLAILVAGAGGLVAVQVATWLLARSGALAEDGGARSAMPDWTRRSFLLRSASVAAAAGVAGLAGRALLTAARSTPTIPVTIPQPGEVATLPAGASLEVDGITPIVVPNAEFYRIDTALLTPNVNVASWQLRVHGLVERETTFTYEELVALPMIEQFVTIACVSNEVGGRLVGNAKWTGVRLRDVLEIAGVRTGATQLVGRSVDGWTAGMPTEWVMDPDREPMIAVKMNDEVLPRNHGFPARLIIPGLYGYVSATKWLSELELTTWEGFDGYWVPLGWSKEGPILTQSRIDVPYNHKKVVAGPVPIAGVAWAVDRGVAAVEVKVDDGAWQPARLSTPISAATWVQWRFDWDAAAAGPGVHRIEVRAIDGTGEAQTDARTPPAPDGARGHHTIELEVA